MQEYTLYQLRRSVKVDEKTAVALRETWCYDKGYNCKIELCLSGSKVYFTILKGKNGIAR